MKSKYHGKIMYTMDKSHPDIEYAKDWTENKVYAFKDEYTFDACYTHEDIIDYIKHDLSLVAGGGYNTEHIHNVKFDIYRL